VIMKTFDYKESYKHLYAKNILAEWLKEKERDKDAVRYPPLYWRHNYGIFVELAFHERDDPYYWEASGGLIHLEDENGNIFDSVFDENFDRGKILFVPDICIFHKGTPTIFLEVYHKNRVQQYKLEAISKFFKGFPIEVWEISADWILSQIKQPDVLKTCELIARL